MLHVSAKGQLISKANFSCSRLNQKMERNYFLISTSENGSNQKSESNLLFQSVRFLVQMGTRKFSFEIKWPLLCIQPYTFLLLKFPALFLSFPEGWKSCRTFVDNHEFTFTETSITDAMKPFSCIWPILEIYLFGLLMESNVLQNFGLELPQIHKKARNFKFGKDF